MVQDGHMPLALVIGIHDSDQTSCAPMIMMFTLKALWTLHVQLSSARGSYARNKLFLLHWLAWSDCMARLYSTSIARTCNADEGSCQPLRYPSGNSMHVKPVAS